MDINIFLRNKLTDISKSIEASKVYIAPNIDVKLINNAVRSFNSNIKLGRVIAIVDTSLLSNGKEGFLFLGDRFFVKDFSKNSLEFLYEDLEGIDLESIFNDKGKELAFKFIIHSSKLNFEFKSPSLCKEMNIALVALLNELVQVKKEKGKEFFKQDEQVKPLESMDEKIKVAYVKLLTNYAFYEENNIRPKDYATIMSFIVKIKMTPPSRLETRAYIFNIKETFEETDKILNYLKNNLTSMHFDILSQSLVKDLLMIYKSSAPLEDWPKDPFISKLVKNFSVSNEEIELILESLILDEQIIKERLDDSQIKKATVELAAKAGAVGVPMAALYFSGIVGVSAAGLTSGLATLGLGGILGFSSMFTGIGVIALIGAGTYQGIKKISGVENVEKYKQREKLLQEIIKNNQRTLNYIVEDINYISSRLVDEIRSGEEVRYKIEKLSFSLDLLSSSASSVNSDLSFYSIEEILTKIPKKIKLDIVRELTNEASLLEVRDFVLACYDEEGVLRDINLDEARELYSVLENIGYMNLSDNSIAGIKSTSKKIISNFLS